MIPAAQLWALDERHGFFRSVPGEPVQLTSGPIRWDGPIPGKDGKKIFARGVILRGELVRFDAQSRQLQPYLSGISAEYLTFSPDGKSVAYVTFPEGILWRANRDGSNPIQLTDPPIYPNVLRWSPDGRQILFFAADSEGRLKLYLLPSQGGKPQALLPSDNTTELDGSWSPDGRKIVFQTTETATAPFNQITCILDLANGHITDIPGSRGLWSPRLSPDGRYIDALTSGFNRDFPLFSLTVFDFKTQQWSVIQKGEVGYPWWSHDGKFIYFLRPVDDPGVYRIRPSGGEAERVVDLKGFRFTSVWRYWMGLDPEDTPLLLRDTGTDDIFALTLEER
jgi:dipeptidyl aminopeptidase/acylaminoacyl peptidase